MATLVYSDSESDTLQDVKSCRLIKRLEGYRPEGCWLVEINPPTQLSIAGKFQAAHEVVLAEKYLGRRIEELKTGTIKVYVFAIVNQDAVEAGRISDKDIQYNCMADIASDPGLLPLGSKTRSLM